MRTTNSQQEIHRDLGANRKGLLGYRLIGLSDSMPTKILFGMTLIPNSSLEMSGASQIPQL